MTIGIRITPQGPAISRGWTKRYERAVAAGLADGEKELLDLTMQDINRTLNQVLRTQTPHFRTSTRIVSNRVENDVIYGPWLEGTGSRNKTTRFKGYATFRKVRGRIEQKSRYVVDRAISKRLKGL